ncbi:MAG TPA: hypothetical protein VFG52_03285, partial [Xanthomonadales bacterium]|nr:hypothetical protein [Xanthomonadales bacterium]
EAVLAVDADTGVNEFVIHPDRPDTLLASTYQRRRHVWTLINGGPGGGIHKSTDGGKTWREISSGLPKGDMGRIGLAAAPSNPSVVYAIVEASADEQGVYRSSDFGEHWVKQSSRMTTSPQYYNEIIVDPHDPDRVYSLDTFSQVSEDAGKTWTKLGFTNRHVDDHALWIDPHNTDHLIIGGDGGIFESFDRGQLWRQAGNLPIVQFYRATPDNDLPFYNVCGGTQDNHSLCGPSQNAFADGISNADWWIAQFGDGFKARIDPTDANVVYAQYQHGGLVRMDKQSGERLAITPQPGAGENDYNWNWNSPLIISPHDHKRLYFGSEKLFRSDDRGESWVAVSPDLSRQVDRNKLEVMGRVWSVDAIAKNASTSIYGAMIALDESPLQEGLLYVGTDDGLIRVSPNGGETWTRVESFGGVPEMSLVEDIIASQHDANVAYAVVDNHKRGDHKPYVLKSTNQGSSWSQIGKGLPERGSAHTIVEDPIDPQLLYVGTEFGLFFSQDGGGSWHEFTELPTIAVRDLEFQQREDDLVIATFGLGIYILDDVSPLRSATAELKKSATLFKPQDSWLYIRDDRRGWGGKGDYGVDRYVAENPPYGAVFSYYLPEEIQSLKKQRQKAEEELARKGEDTFYPDWEELRREDREEAPTVVLTVTDSEGNVVRRVDGKSAKGFHRVAWDLRYPAPDPVTIGEQPERSPWERIPAGPLAVPGEYQVTLSKRVLGEWQDLAGPHAFTLKPMYTGGLVTTDQQARLKFEMEAAELYRAVSGTDKAAAEVASQLDHLLAALPATPAADEALAQQARALKTRLQDLQVLLNGDQTRSGRYVPVPLSLTSRIGFIIGGYWESQAAVPQGYRDSLAIARAEYVEAEQQLQQLAAETAELGLKAEALGAPWTPGRLPRLRQ